MDGPSMWRFKGVFESNFLDRGEKCDEVILVEEAMAKDLKQYRPDQLRDMIDKEVKSMMGSFMNQMKPIFSKRVSYSVDQLEFRFFNLDKEFA